MAKERVNYSEIENSCNNLTNLATSLQSTIENLESITSQITDPTWGGEAADSYLQKIRSLCKHLPDANRQLAEAVLFLASCADGYKSIEAGTLQKLTDIIGEDYIKNYDVNSAPDVDLSSRVSIEKPEKEASEPQTTPETKSSTPSSNYSGNNSGGAYSGSSGGYHGSSSAGYVASAAPAAAVAPAVVEDKKTEKEEEEELKTLEKGEKTEIADSIKQDKNKVKEYKDNKFKEGSAEESIEKLWKEQGSTENEGIATIKVEEEERYLVKVSPQYGKVGDSIDVNLKDGSVVKCVIAETKEIKGENANIYGTVGEDGKVNIIEFEATKDIKEVKFPWDENSSIKEISNNGSVLENKATATEIIENKTFPAKVEVKPEQPSEEIPKLDDTPQKVNTDQNSNTGNIESKVE